MSTSRPPRLAIVGATGAVGREMMTILEQRRTRHASLRLFASPRSAGSTLTYRGEPVTVEALVPGALRDVDVALFSAGSSISKTFGPEARAAGVTVIDNSSAFRADPACPLIIPEVNPGDLESVRGKPAIIANPNCSTIILLMALAPLRAAFGLRRAVVSTYQAVSGAGAKAMDELVEQSREVLAGREARPSVFQEPCAFNLFSHNSAVDPATGQNVEEQKMLSESRRILNDDALALTATCVRVPVLRAHSQSVNITLERAASEKQVREVLAGAPGVRILDDRAANRFPTPLKASGGDDVLVGRIRPDLSQPRPGARAGEPIAPDQPTLGFEMFIAGDQLRKGAALNAIQIAEMLFGSMR
jgi:aspartate-semialdehyde dehydrogenase